MFRTERRNMAQRLEFAQRTHAARLRLGDAGLASRAVRSRGGVQPQQPLRHGVRSIDLEIDHRRWRYFLTLKYLRSGGTWPFLVGIKRPSVLNM